MAEEGSLLELEGLEKQLQSLIRCYSSDDLRGDGKTFCSDYRKLVEEYASHWRSPLPRLRILEAALSHFTQASSSFASSCDHVLRTLSSLALSVFELLLFFDERDFHQEPLKHFSVKFQECYSALLRHQNVHLVQVEPLLGAGGAWANTTLKEILSESNLPQNEVDGFLSSESPVFLELRVRYLISCQRVSEALALAKCCVRHPSAGKHAFFLQVYLTWLYKTQYNQLLKEVADLSGKDAVHIICSLENEETNELLLALCQVFLSQQLCRGDMYYLWELVFIWSKLHHRLNTSKEAFLEESRRLMLSATNVNAVFPFVRVVIEELGEDGVQFCVELCADALKSRLPCDAVTKSLIYKTVAGLLPNDLEVCRACALLVFFSERSVGAYKMVSLLYMLPDQDYHVEHSPIRNQIRFETLQILKKDLYFDPEFWNLLALQTSCLELMSEKVVDDELMEETWLPNYCTKEFSLVCSTATESSDNGTAKKPDQNEGGQKEMSSGEAPKKLKLGQGKTGLNHDGGAVKKKANHRSRYPKGASSQPLRRSFWQLDRIHDAGSGQLRRATRLSEKNPPKRRIQKPKWLLEDSGNAQEPKHRKRGLRHRRVHRSSALKRSENGQPKNGSAQPKVSENARHERGFPPDSVEAAPAPQIVLELSLPDNELMGTFAEDCNRAKGCPPLLFYKPTLKHPDPSHPAKAPHGKEVVLRARDATMLVQLLHCYARRPKGKGNGAKSRGSVSTITRSSAHGSPPKEPRRENGEKTNADTPVGRSSEDALATEHPEAPSPPLAPSEKEHLETVEKGLSSEKSVVSNGTEIRLSAQTAHSPNTDEVHTAVEARELNDGMTLTLASQSPAAEQVAPRPSAASAEVTQIFDTQSRQIEDDDASPPSATPTSQSPDSPRHRPPRDGQAPVNIDENPKALGSYCEIDKTSVDDANEDTQDARPQYSHSTDDLSASVTEMLTRFPPVELPRDSETCKRPPDTQSEESVLPEPSAAAHMQGNDRERSAEDEDDDDDDFEDDETIETEESKLEYRCTFCQRDFKGRRVVAHAMFHFRKDECMFCGTAFKDDLLAMMHLSDHIEKLKRSKEAASNKAQASAAPETKDFAQAKTSAKADVPHRPSGHRVSKKPRKSASCDQSACHPEAHSLSETRNLRSNDKPAESRLAAKTSECKLNGLLGKKTPFDSKAEDHRTPRGNHVTPKSRESCAPPIQRRKCVESFQDDVIQDGKVSREKRAEPLAKVDCPADGCAWSTDLSKNRVALLYHALESHHGDVKPLELSLKVANNKCSICMRVLWSLEHFQHHVERHRLSPRHPCLHLGCAARFKTANEMRRHARKHSPLQAACCLPGCPKLFICLWALNLHEREHYASKTSKPAKTADPQTDNKANGAQLRATNRTCRKSRGRPSRDAAARIGGKTSAMKEELKTKNESKHSNVLKNLSNKETATQSSNHTLNLRLRKGPTSRSNPGPPKNPLLPIFRRRNKLRHKFKQKPAAVNQTQMFPRRRGRPRKSKKAHHDENTTKDPNGPSLKSESPDGPETAASPAAGNKFEIKEEQQQVDDPGKGTETLHQNSKSKTTESGLVEPKVSPDKGSPLTAASRNSVVRALKLRVLNLRKRCASKDAESLEAGRAKKERLTRRKSPRRGSGWSVSAKSASVDVARRPGDEKRARSLSPSGSPAEQLPAPDAVKNALPKKKKSGELQRTSEDQRTNVTSDGSGPTASSLNRKSKKDASDVTRNASAAFNVKRKSKVKPPRVMSQVCSAAATLRRKAEEKPSDVSSGASGSETSNGKRKFEEEPSDPLSPASATTADNFKRKSKEEPSDATSDGSGSTTVDLNRETAEEPSDAARNGSSCTAAVGKTESEPSNVTGDGSGCAGTVLKTDPEEEPSDTTRDDSGSTPSILKTESREETGFTSTTSNLKRKSKKEPSNVTGDGSGCAGAVLKTDPGEEPSDTTRDDSGSTPSILKTESREETGSTSTASNLKRKSKKEPSNVTSDGSGSASSDLKRKSKKKPSNATRVCSGSTSSLVRAGPPSKSKDARPRKTKDGEIKRSKKKKHPDNSSAPEWKTEASEGGEVTIGQQADDCVGAPVRVDKTPECAKDDARGHSTKPVPAKEADVSTLCMDTLAEYGKKHMRAPPTAYLDEKFTAMRKKRKEAAASDARASLEEDLGAAAATQRQRCGKCFAAFNGAQELQSHLRLQRCSGLFGFDSDDDVNS